MTDITVTLSRSTFVDRLRKLQDRLTDENDHDAAFLIGLAIQAIMTEPHPADLTVKRIIDVVHAGLKDGHFDSAAHAVLCRLSHVRPVLRS